MFVLIQGHLNVELYLDVSSDAPTKVQMCLRGL